MLRLIAAMDSKRGLATNAGIPWDLPSDKRFYLDQVKDGLILMGAGTYHKFRKPMPDRINYVVTHGSAPLSPGFEAVHDLATFLETHQGETVQDIGGAGLYRQTLQYADELVLTLINGDFSCTKFFPNYTQNFECVSQSDPITENGIPFRFTTWHRKSI